MDVKTLRDPFVDQTGRGRQHPIQTLARVDLRLLDGDRVVRLEGQAIELSQAEVVVRLQGRETVEFFQGLGTTSSHGELLFLATGEVRRGRIERLTLDVEQLLATVRMDFQHPEDLSALLPDERAGASVRLRLRIGTGDTLTLTDAARHMYWLSQAGDAARAVMSELGAQLGAPNSEVQPHRVASISVGSLEVVIETTVGVGLLLVGAFRGWLSVRKAYWESEKAKQEALALRWDNEQEGVLAKIDALSLVRRASDWLSRSGGKDLERSVESGRAEVIAAKQLFPAVAEIIEAAEGDVEVAVDGGSADEGALQVVEAPWHDDD